MELANGWLESWVQIMGFPGYIHTCRSKATATGRMSSNIASQWIEQQTGLLEADSWQHQRKSIEFHGLNIYRQGDIKFGEQELTNINCSLRFFPFGCNLSNSFNLVNSPWVLIEKNTQDTGKGPFTFSTAWIPNVDLECVRSCHCTMHMLSQNRCLYNNARHLLWWCGN
jgi:hypothetical protein